MWALGGSIGGFGLHLSGVICLSLARFRASNFTYFGTELPHEMLKHGTQLPHEIPFLLEISVFLQSGYISDELRARDFDPGFG